MPNETMSLRALNRATLARQMLLEREKVPALKAIERLAGLQAQQARPPFVGLWSRVEGFQREELHKLLHARKAVRATMMRCTIHLVSVKDFLAWRAAIQPVLSYAMQAVLKDRSQGMDVDGVITTARTLFEEEPRPFAALREALLQHYPTADERAMGFTVRTLLPLVLVPEETTWGYSADAAFTVAEPWLGQKLGTDATPHALVQRYLAAFGPATAADVQAWSGLKGIQTVLEELRPKLVVFRDERKRELFDLPKAPRPAEDTPVPVRFIADFDNLVLGHADRTRLMKDEHRSRIVTKNLLVLPTFLVDGFVAGLWKITRTKTAATLEISPFVTLPARVKTELSAEGEKLVRFVEPDAVKVEVKFASAK